MATLRAAPTRHRQTEQFSGILTNQHLPGPDLKMEGGTGKKYSTKLQASNKAIAGILCE